MASSFFTTLTIWLGSFSPAQIWLFTKLRGTKIGADEFGNVYYETKARPGRVLPRRWVIYKKGANASIIPPEWHGWLHHQNKEKPLANNSVRRPWQKSHEKASLSTEKNYHPPGYGGHARQKSTGDYEAWQPPG